jgi:hypothetical protein
MSCGRFSDRRRRARGECLADDWTVRALRQEPDPFALRVTRPGARTRSGPSLAIGSASVRGKPSPPVSHAREAPAPIPLLAADLGDIALNHNSDWRDF